MSKKTCAGLALTLAAASAQAVGFVEGTDFPNFSSFPGVSVGSFGPGVHSVSGRIAGNCVVGDCNGPGGGDTQDSFSFTVAAGTLITQLTLASSAVTGPPGFSVSLQLISQGGGVFANVGALPINGQSGNLLSQPMGAGLYSLSVYGQGAAQAGAYSFPYGITFNPQAIPEPGTALLLALGGTALLVRRRLAGRSSA